MLRSIFIILLTLSLNLQAQTKDQKEFMQYCMHEANAAQMYTIRKIANEPTKERACKYLARSFVPVESHRAVRLRN